jgi:hypothetical protein
MSMKTTNDLRNKLLRLWEKFDNGELDAAEARVHIGFARSALDTLKVEIAAASLGNVVISSLPLNSDFTKNKISSQ